MLACDQQWVELEVLPKTSELLRVVEPLDGSREELVEEMVGIGGREKLGEYNPTNEHIVQQVINSRGGTQPRHMFSLHKAVTLALLRRHLHLTSCYRDAKLSPPSSAAAQDKLLRYAELKWTISHKAQKLETQCFDLHLPLKDTGAEASLRQISDDAFYVVNEVVMKRLGHLPIHKEYLSLTFTQRRNNPNQ
ncbi:hypothetical protein ANCCEY_10163 [Ancylostoma ceylanicum]|uniref:Uncharacterized protein n=1 Tax=Ancylostoma ceylanicum TaxID=53326 RepID=A0A0D6LSX3_9BILA|nr:hypothetical protein ANCCEY_10163 [Ancylostoma ceylanicum]